jgi:RNA polymerase sigma-70 factor, ECF subfamily
VAVGFASGPSDGLALLDGLDLPRYQPLYAARAELLSRAGDVAGADAAYARAVELSGNAAERAALERRRLSRR